MSHPPLGTGPYAHRPGCPLCSIVATPHPRSDLLASPSVDSPTTPTPWRRDSNDGNTFTTAPTSIASTSSSSSTTNVVIYKDANITAYVEKKYPVSSKGHIIIPLNLHVPSLYVLSSTDLPLLNHIQATATRLLQSLNPPPPSTSPGPGSPDEERARNRIPLAAPDLPIHIGFITPPFKDSKIPITDHLHAHAYVGRLDLAGWWRGMSYTSLAWYSIQDLIAEIRESTSNNRIKTGYSVPNRPIDMVPTAGAISGTSDGLEGTFRPLPLQVNKAHMSPSPTPHLQGPVSSSSTARVPELQFEHVATGSVDLGTGYQTRVSSGGTRVRPGGARAPNRSSSASSQRGWEEVEAGPSVPRLRVATTS